MPAADGLKPGGRPLAGGPGGSGALSRPLDRVTARAAAAWMVRLREQPSPAEVAACEHWRQADPEHERAWSLAQALDAKFGVLPRQVGLPTLGRRHRDSRRGAVKTLTALLVAGPTAYLAWDRLPWQRWTSDERTAVGERRTLALEDGTRIALNTASAVDVRDSATERRVVLRAGEVLIETGSAARTPAPARPLVVWTPRGQIRARGTRFVVRDEEASDATRVSVLAGAVDVVPADAPGSARLVAAGHQVRFSASALGPIEPVDSHVADWSRGVLFADRMRLDDFVAELGRHRIGVLRCQPEVAGLRLTGAFQLDHIDAILATLPRTLPVRVVYRTRYWVVIGAAA